MGTNFYLHENICQVCGRFNERHIGKSSYGWCFGLHIYPDERINSLEDWKLLFDSGEIYDEYGRRVSKDEMIDIITNRSHPDSNENDEWYAQNHAERGPNNLARSKIDGVLCVGHGEGTWDYLVGDFS